MTLHSQTFVLSQSQYSGAITSLGTTGGSRGGGHADRKGQALACSSAGKVQLLIHDYGKGQIRASILILYDSRGIKSQIIRYLFNRSCRIAKR